jgi:peroxiredoxin Q/BCP
MALAIGTKAPEFTLPSTSGNSITLSEDLADKSCVLYFYPKDFTPGCNAEACEFRDHFETFRDLDIPVIGISKDSIETHLKFQKKHKLPFELLSDRFGTVVKKYDALMPIINLPNRVTYLLDKKHVVRAVYKDQFGSKNHIKAMLKEINK